MFKSLYPKQITRFVIKHLPIAEVEKIISWFFGKCNTSATKDTASPVQMMQKAKSVGAIKPPAAKPTFGGGCSPRMCACFARASRRTWEKEEKRYDRSTRCTGGGSDAGGDAGGLRRGGHNESGRADEDGQMDGTVETRRYDRALAASLSQLILNRIGE